MMTLEDNIDKIKWGIKFIDLGVESRLNPENPPIDPLNYATRAEGINERTDRLEGLGIVIGIVKNVFLHPKVINDYYVRKQ